MNNRLKHEFEGSDFKKPVRYIVIENDQNFQIIQSNFKNYAVYRETQNKRVFLDTVGTYEEARALIKKSAFGGSKS